MLFSRQYQQALWLTHWGEKNTSYTTLLCVKVLWCITKGMCWSASSDKWKMPWLTEERKRLYTQHCCAWKCCWRVKEVMVEMCLCLLIQCHVELQAPSVNRTLFQWVWDSVIDRLNSVFKIWRWNTETLGPRHAFFIPTSEWSNFRILSFAGGPAITWKPNINVPKI